MTRQIKFRVYNNKQNKWVHGPGNEVNLFGETILFGAFMNNVPTEELNDCVALEYTGLTDKNGKEIYEGDIIHLKFGELNANLVVKWDKYMGLKYHNGGWTSMVHVNTHGEVIGNIFEHSELLN